MTVSVSSQFELFVLFLLLGLALGVGYELCRVPRLLLRIHPVLVCAADVLFSFFASCVLFTVTFVRNDGQLRLYCLLSAAIGLLFYEVTLGRVIVFLTRKIKLSIRRKPSKG